MPIGTAIAKGARVILRTMSGQWQQIIKNNNETFGEEIVLQDLATYVPGLPPDVIEPHEKNLSILCQNYLRHQFNLLGSGWVEVKHGIQALGFEGHKFSPSKIPLDILNLLNPGNRDRAKKIRTQISSDYIPIDWQLDFKSGYRWTESHIASRLQYGHEPGVDIKVPWELARLQHLPQLAVAYAAAHSDVEGFEEAAVYKSEFQNQALDFIAANPPGFGVNWFSAMDVSIRAANLLVAFDIFKRHNAEFDLKFIAEFNTSIREHGKFIEENFSLTHKANHYLTEICGLLYIAAYLPETEQSNHWLNYCIEELSSEVERQFLPDGGNFEASTSYHRLSGEAVLYASALTLGLPEDRISSPPFKPWYLERLERLAEFTQHITKPSGHVIQIGDNDNGRFFKICPPIRDSEEEILDHRSLIGAANGLFRRRDFTRTSGLRGYVDATLIGGISDGNIIPTSVPNGSTPPAQDRSIKTVGEVAEKPPENSKEAILVLADTGILFELKSAAYPEFGLYIWWSRRFFLSIRCGGLNKDGLGAHAHNDQLSIELQIDGIDWIADPGSYIYTPTPRHRNLYRSALAHNGPHRSEREPARLDAGLFKLDDQSDAECLHFDATGFFGYYTGYGEPVSRLIAFGKDRIIIRDSIGSIRPVAAKSIENVEIASPKELQDSFTAGLPFSPGYGKVITET
jgi:hypothetical protein